MWRYSYTPLSPRGQKVYVSLPRNSKPTTKKHSKPIVRSRGRQSARGCYFCNSGFIQPLWKRESIHEELNKTLFWCILKLWLRTHIFNRCHSCDCFRSLLWIQVKYLFLFINFFASLKCHKLYYINPYLYHLNTHQNKLIITNFEESFSFMFHHHFQTNKIKKLSYLSMSLNQRYHITSIAIYDE